MLTKQFRQFEQWAEDQERTKALKNKMGMNAEEKLHEINEFLDGLSQTSLQPSHRILVNEIKDFIEGLNK